VVPDQVQSRPWHRNRTQAQFASFVDAELIKWGKVISDAKVTIN
jgi:hypothetical protein